MTYDFSKVTEYLNMLHTEKGLPSADAVIYYKGKPVYRHIVGCAAEDTLYYLFSCTKPVTAVAAMQLIERGVIGLDDPVSRYFPSFAEAVYQNGDELVPVGDSLTVRHLFTMTAGLNYRCETDAIKRIIKANPDASTLDIIPAFIEDTPLDFKPGTRYSYSLCLDVLAGVIETASGMRFSEYLKKNIFDPLNMTDAMFRVPDEKKSRLAPAFDVEDNRVVPCKQGIGGYGIAPNYESGGAGLVCSTADYGKFAAAMSMGGISENGVRILSKESLDLLRTPQITREMGFYCSVGRGYAYGLGVRTLVTHEFGAKSHIGEFGWDGAAGAYILIDPDAEVAISYTQQLRGWQGYFGVMHSPIREHTYEALGI